MIALQLSNHAERLVRELFPDARPEGCELRWHGRDGAIWSMVVRGLKHGVWCNWGDKTQCGDALELVHYALFPDETGRRDSITWAARWLGIDNSSDLDPAHALELRRKAVDAMRRRALAQKEQQERTRRRAVGIYLDGRQSVPVPLTPELASYLQHRLGAPIEELSGLPRSLRFSPAFAYDSHLAMPAMLAPIVDPMSGQQIATHATYLDTDDAGVWRKARMVPAKKVFGAYRGGIIPLLRGASGKPLKLAPDGDTILIGEGIENSLAASLLVDGDPRVVACVAVGNLPSLELPIAFTNVILAYDRDGENEGVRKARDQAYARFLAEHRAVRTIKPPHGSKDFADYLLADARGFVA